MSIPKVPPLSAELVSVLNQRFPLRLPKEEWSDRKIWIEVGKREVIEFLITEHKRQQENTLQASVIY